MENVGATIDSSKLKIWKKKAIGLLTMISSD